MDPVQEKNETSDFFVPTSIPSLNNKNLGIKISAIALFIIVTVLASLSSLLSPPPDFPEGKIITIESGDSLRSVSNLLKNEHLIRSQSLFELCAKVVGGEKPVVAGDYLFKEPASACAVASRISRGISGVPQVRITIPEGMSNSEIATVLAKNLTGFDKTLFIKSSGPQEGFLFPDTYFFPENAMIEKIEEAMQENFDKKIEPLRAEIEISGLTLRDIVIMASILEKEATTDKDKAIVSGILWKRISMGMPLQVDATFMYLLGKTSSELTAGDLKTSSPYNTYQNKGLPAGPIGNPGLVAISAALHPVSSPYLYYLSDKDGVMHYAKTFAEHIANKTKYLK